MADNDDIPRSIANRFRNLDFDDVPRARPRKVRAPADKASPAPPAATPPTSIVERSPPVGVQGRRSPTVAPPVERPTFGSGGVIVEEVDFRRRSGAVSRAPGPMTTGQARPGVYAGRNAEPSWPQQRSGRSPVALTLEAARRIRLMAHHAGVPGAGLRLVLGASQRLEECEFVFEAVAEPDDVVILDQGVHIYLDPVAFDVLRGVLVSYDDLPGLAGFRISKTTMP